MVQNLQQQIVDDVELKLFDKETTLEQNIDTQVSNKN